MKNKCLFFAALAFLAASCSKDKDSTPDDGTGTPGWTTYKVLDTKAELGFYILDRNVGATEVYNGDSKNPNAASVGYYYQWGKNTPVTINADGSISKYNKEWNAAGDSLKDWSKGENTPCPSGWRIPNQAEMKKITDAAWADYEFDTQTAAQTAAAEALYKKLVIARTGYIRILGADASARSSAKAGIYLNAAGFFWTGALNADAAVSTRGFKYAYTLSDNGDILLGKKGGENEVNVAMPIRCIKDEK